MAKWKAGQQSPNPSGRPRGSANKISNELRIKISQFLNLEFNNIKKDFRKMDPREKTKVYVDLLSFVLPKLKSPDVEINFERLTDEQLDQIIESLKKPANETVRKN